MKIYTKTGDDGNTGVQGNMRIAKSHRRIVAYGTVDEANAALGMALSDGLDGDISSVLTDVQNDLFVVGADLSNPSLNDVKNRVSLGMIRRLESEIDRFEAELPPLSNFILPGGAPAAARMHHARAIVRRAETQVVALSEKDEINSNCIIYLNRLSDLLFVLGRTVNIRGRIGETPWNPKDKL